MYKISQIDIATIELFSDSIFIITMSHGACVDLDGAKRLIRTINQMLTEKQPFISGIFDMSHVDEAALDAGAYFVSGQDLQSEVISVALFSTTKKGIAIADAIIGMHNPQNFPIKTFASPMRAEHWVRTKMKLKEQRPDSTDTLAVKSVA